MKTYATVPETPFLEGSDDEKVWLAAMAQAVRGYTSTRYTQDGKTSAMSSRIVAQRAVEIADQVTAEFQSRRKASKALKPRKEN